MKDPEALVEALGRELRHANQAIDPRWDRLASGELPAEELEALLASSPVLPPEREEALLRQALGATGAAGPVTPVRARPRRAWFALAVAAVLAVVALAVIVRPRAALPQEYALEATGDAVVLGPEVDAGAGAGELVVSAGTRVRLSLTPLSGGTAEVVARLFLVSGEEARAVPIRPAAGRVVHVEGLREELFPGAPAGRYALVILIARVGTAGDEAALTAMARDPARDVAGWRRIERAVALRGAPEGRVVPVPKEVEEAAALRGEGRLEEAEKKLAQAPAGLAKTRLAARLALAQGRAEEAAARFREAIAGGREAGDAAGTGKDVLALVYVLLQVKHDEAAATAVLEEAREVLAAWPAGAADVLYTRGQIAHARGDLRGALADLRAAAEEADRVGLVLTRDAARELRDDVLSTLGRHREALANARSIALPAGRTCRAGDARINAAWIEIRAVRAGAGGDAKRAEALLGEALGIIRTSCPVGIGKVLTNLAIASLEVGDRQGARKSADEAEQAEIPADPVDAVWWAQVRAEADLGDGHPETARVHFEEARALGERHHLPEATFEGALGRALTFDAMNRVKEAHHSFEEASRALDAWAREAPLGEGRGSFLAEHARAVRLHAAFLLRRGRAADALLVVRRGASRYLALLDHPGALTIEPPPIPAGMAMIAPVMLPDGPALLASLDEKVVSARAPGGAADGLGAWVEPFASQLRAAHRLVLPAGGAFREVDVHAAPLEGRPLVAHFPVAYTLDLPPMADAPRPASPVALVVADPGRDLPAVRATIDPLRASLEGQGFRVTLLSGDAASREAVRAAVTAPDVYLLYYAGHASFGGRDGLDAALALADGPLSVRDVLDLTRVPPYAILLGCSSGRTEVGVDSLGLAQAFLLRGTLAAVAARADLDAAVVEKLGARLVAELGASVDLPASLARAEAALDREGPPLRWSVLRALVR